MNFNSTVFQLINDALIHIEQHPFIVNLKNTSLDEKIFQSFLQQDRLFLYAYAKAMHQLAKKAPDKESERIILNLASGVIEEEDFLQGLCTDPSLQKSNSVNNTYQSLILDKCRIQFEQGIAVILPCFLIYKALFADLKLVHPIYSKWVQTYQSNIFLIQTEEVLQLTKKTYDSAELSIKQSMLKQIAQASQLEWHFFNAVGGEFLCPANSY